MNSTTEQETSTLNVINGRTFHNTKSSYWLPNDAAENDRLTGQHFAVKSLFNGNFNPKALEYVSFENATCRVLDCGCGPGTWITDVAAEYPNCQFTGVDISDVFPKDVPPNVHFEVGSVLNLPFDDNTFDYISLRFLIIALRGDEWSIALKEIYRVLKPGGIIESMECGQLSAGGDFVSFLVSKIETFMTSRGQDPHIPLRIPTYMKDVGFEVVETRNKAIYLGETDATNRAFLWDVINIYKSTKPFMSGLLNLQTDEEYDAFLEKVAIECQQEPQAMWEMIATMGRKPL